LKFFQSQKSVGPLSRRCLSKTLFASTTCKTGKPPTMWSSILSSSAMVASLATLTHLLLFAEVCLLLQGFGCQSWQPQRVRRVVSVSEIRISRENAILRGLCHNFFGTRGGNLSPHCRAAHVIQGDTTRSKKPRSAPRKARLRCAPARAGAPQQGGGGD